MTTTATTTAVTAGNKVISEQSAQAKAIIAKANAKKVFVSTAKDELKTLVEKEIDVPATKPATTKEVKAKSTIKPAAKAVAKPKEVKAPILTLWEIMGTIMKQNPQGSAAQIMNKANQFYTKKTGKESNPEQIAKYYRFSSLILKGYNAK